MADVTRRTLLAGAAAGAASMATVAIPYAAVTLRDPGELELLFEAYRDARRRHDAADDAYAEYERHWQARGGPKEPREEDRFWSPIVDASQVEDDALRRLIDYRPQTLEEVRRRADFILAKVPMIDALEADFFEAIVKSLTTEVVA